MKKKFYILLISFLILSNPGNAENFLLINEVFPNPKGSDKKEWIEIYNVSKKTINLQDYKLLINKKTYKIKKNIPIEAKSYSILKKSDIKFSLNNNGLDIKLLDKNNYVISKLNLNESPEGLSYSNIKIISKSLQKNKYFWTSPTPGKKNPTFFEFEGKVKIPVSLANNYYLILNNTKIIIDETKQDIKLLKNLIKKNSQIIALIDENKILQKFKIISNPKTEHKKNNSKLIALILCIPIAILLLILIKLSMPQKPD